MYLLARSIQTMVFCVSPAIWAIRQMQKLFEDVFYYQWAQSAF